MGSRAPNGCMAFQWSCPELDPTSLDVRPCPALCFQGESSCSRLPPDPRSTSGCTLSSPITTTWRSQSHHCSGASLAPSPKPQTLPGFHPTPYLHHSLSVLQQPANQSMAWLMKCNDLLLFLWEDLTPFGRPWKEEHPGLWVRAHWKSYVSMQEPSLLNLASFLLCC